MKTTLTALIVAALLGLAGLNAYHQLAARHAEERAQRQAAWDAEKAELEAALAAAQERAPAAPLVSRAVPASTTFAAPVGKTSAAELIAKLRALPATPGRPRAARRVIQLLEELIALGPDALPAIRAVLQSHEDSALASSEPFKNFKDSYLRDTFTSEFLVPPSLRFGLFDVVKQIGGADAEKLLAEVLSGTGQGVEVAWLARALQEMSPNSYRDAALATARTLLARPTANPPGPLDRFERDQLFGVLTMYGDTGFVATAQGQLLRADGQVDGSALKYLMQTLGQQSVAIAAQMYDDPRLTDPAKKEPLARLALTYVGADAQANEFYLKAINDLTLPKDDRKNLIEDLNQDGFSDRKNLTARDLALIENRLALIEQLAPAATDPVNLAAMKEAHKDLTKMRDRVLNPPPVVK